MSLTKIQTAQLNKIAKSHNSDPQNPDTTAFALVKEKSVSALVKAGYIAIPAGVAANEAGEVPARATAEGVAYLASVAAGTVAPASKPTFALVSAVAIPEAKRGNHGGGRSLYPFDDMEKGQSFFVPCDTGETANDTAKKLASSVSSANKRFILSSTPKLDDGVAVVKNGKPAMVHTYSKHFVLRPIEDGAQFNQTGVAGAAVWRDL